MNSSSKLGIQLWILKISWDSLDFVASLCSDCVFISEFRFEFGKLRGKVTNLDAFVEVNRTAWKMMYELSMSAFGTCYIGTDLSRNPYQWNDNPYETRSYVPQRVTKKRKSHTPLVKR